MPPAGGINPPRQRPGVQQQEPAPGGPGSATVIMVLVYAAPINSTVLWLAPANPLTFPGLNNGDGVAIDAYTSTVFGAPYWARPTGTTDALSLVVTLASPLPGSLAAGTNVTFTADPKNDLTNPNTQQQIKKNLGPTFDDGFFLRLRLPASYGQSAVYFDATQAGYKAGTVLIRDGASYTLSGDSAKVLITSSTPGAPADLKASDNVYLAQFSITPNLLGDYRIGDAFLVYTQFPPGLLNLLQANPGMNVPGNGGPVGPIGPPLVPNP